MHIIHVKCKKCGSYAINNDLHGRDGLDDDLCDVCYWRKRASHYHSKYIYIVLTTEKNTLPKVVRVFKNPESSYNFIKSEFNGDEMWVESHCIN